MRRLATAASLLLLLLLPLWCHCTAASSMRYFPAIRAFLTHNRVRCAVLYTCPQDDSAALSKKLSDDGFAATSAHKNINDYNVSKLLNVEWHHLSIIVDSGCDGSTTFLTEASRGNKFGIQHHWLILPRDEGPVLSALTALNVPVDGHVTVAVPGSLPGRVILKDVYHLGEQPFLTEKPSGSWAPGDRWPSEPPRTNYGAMHIKTAVIVVQDPWEHFFDMRYKHLNTLSKNNYALMAYVAEMLNFRMNLTMTDSWGYPVNGSKDYAGIVGLMQRGEVEIGAAGLLVKETRMDYVDYAGEIVTFRGAFMFLKPSLSEVSIIYTLPFSNSVWATFVATVIILTVGLEFSQRLFKKVNPSESNHRSEWSEAVVNSIGIICEQGAETAPEDVSSRIIFLALLLMSVFVLTSYSASIVSLLQTSSDAINTLSELMDSGLHLSMRDIGFNTNYANDTTDPVIRRLYRDYLFAQPYHKAFTTQEEGVEKIRTGLNAFHGDAGAYKVMSDTFEEYDKCRLKEIKMYSTDKLAFPVKKGSQFREHITQKARWLREVGLVGREYKRWFSQRPKCDSNSQGFVSVKLLDFYPVLMVLVFGMAAAVAIFFGEVLKSALKQGACRLERNPLQEITKNRR
ncbi:Ionotropic receptor 75d [Blattella germanica]|nr:Ionotropic receptor 75d [Blattella germanica]